MIQDQQLPQTPQEADIEAACLVHFWQFFLAFDTSKSKIN